MSSKQQFKEYSTRLKTEIKKLKAENEALNKQVFRLKMQPKELNLPVVTNWRFWNDNRNNRIVGFVVGLITGIVIYACL